jgi:oligosaccharide repeat unit polymerase
MTLIFSIYLFQRSSGSLSPLKPNLHSLIFYYSLLISSFIGPLLIVLKIDHHYMLDRLVHQEIRVIGFLYICYIMIFLPLSMFVVSKILGFKADKEFTRYIHSPISVKPSDNRDFFYIISFLSFISVLSIIYTFIKLDHIPILELFKGSSDLGVLRIEASRGFKGNEYIRNIFAIGLTPILSFIAYSYATISHSRRWRALFIVLFFLSILMNVYDLQKAPVFFYFLMFIILNIYLGKFVLNVKRILVIGLTGVVLLVIMYVYIQGVTAPDQFLSYNTGPVGRMILSQISPFFLHLDLFGDRIPFLHGRSLPNILLHLYDFEQVRSARETMEYVYPEKVAEGIAGVLNTIFAGEAYANFGMAGILIGTIYIGVFVQVMYISFIRLKKHPVSLSVFMYFTVTIPRVMVGGFVDFVFNPFWILLLVLFIGLLVLQKVKVDLIKGFKEYLAEEKKVV